jgi:c(7)-type cytochrome triheme protein
MKLRFISITTLIIIASVVTLAAALEIKDATFTTESAGKVVFKHSTHMKKKSAKSPNISCKSCHNDSMKKGVKYTMAQMEQGKSCGQCHNGRKAFALTRCTACHKVKDISMKVKDTGPVLFRHSSHLKKSEYCGTCHNMIFKTSGNATVKMAEMEKGKSCGACHNGKKTFSLASCTTCHPVKDRKFSVKDAGNVIFSHTSHITMYKCGDCHSIIYEPAKSKIKKTMTQMEAGESCGACHDGKGAFTVKENCETCHKM